MPLADGLVIIGVGLALLLILELEKIALRRWPLFDEAAGPVVAQPLSE